MLRILNYFLRYYKQVITSIAFWPTLMVIGFLIFAGIITRLEYLDAVMGFKENIKFLFIQGEENVRTVLGALIGGTISLTVFSFSMVMIVLSSASSNLSPRVLPGLITDKGNQFVLGFYLGSLVYDFMIITNIVRVEEENGGGVNLPTLSILFAMLFGLASLGLFVYFIHSISRSIQVDHILNEIFNTTHNQIKKLKKKQKGEQASLPDTKDWFTIKSNRAGYFKSTNSDELKKILKINEAQLVVKVERGFFTVNGYPFLSVNKELDEETQEMILECFVFYIEEYVSDHYVYGFKQISEIAVKALSPGINDPGTAVKAIDMLTILFTDHMDLPECDFGEDSEGVKRVFYKEMSTDELLYKIFTPIRSYGKGDPQVMLNLLESFKNLLYAAKDQKKLTEVLQFHVLSIRESVAKNIDNSYDREQINGMIQSINKILPTPLEFEKLEEKQEAEQD